MNFFADYSWDKKIGTIIFYTWAFEFCDLSSVNNIKNGSFSDVIFSFRQYLMHYILQKMGNNCCRAKDEEEEKIEKNVLFFIKQILTILDISI